MLIKELKRILNQTDKYDDYTAKACIIDDRGMGEQTEIKFCMAERKTIYIGNDQEGYNIADDDSDSGYQYYEDDSHLLKKNKTSAEIKKWLLENCVDGKGNLDLSYLDFRDFNGDIMIDSWKVKGNINFSGCRVDGNLYQNEQFVKGNLYQGVQNVDGDLDQSEQHVKGNLFQNYHEVDGNLYQDGQQVGGDLEQGCQQVKGDCYQGSQEIEGALIDL